MKKGVYYLILLVVVCLSGCNREGGELDELKRLPVKFNTIIVEDIQTRAKDASWESGDKIGVFAINSGASLQTSSIVEDYANLAFSTTGDGVFHAEGKSIYYPEDNKAMDFISYYPYKANLTNCQYPIDINEQLDFFYSDNLKEVIENGEVKTLQFQRILSRLVLNISPKKSGSLENLEVLVSGVKTKATFSLADGSLLIDNSSEQTMTLTPNGSNTEKKIDVIFLPTNDLETVNITFKIGDKNIYKWKLPHKLEKGKVYTYNIELDKISTIITRPKDYMEIPYYTASESAPNSYKAVHMVGSVNWLNPSYTRAVTRNYTVLYDTENHIPYWIAYPMHPMYLKSGNRTDDWAYDPIIPVNYQPNILNNSWANSTYNRGHMLASADRNATKAINRTTFYATNMVPQNSKMNGGTWNNLEQKVREWSKQSSYDTLYVVTGSILPPKGQIQYTTDKHGKQVAIPSFLYKALLRQDKSTKKYYSIAFKMENRNTGNPYQNSVISIEELEQETGFAFFPNATDIENVKKQKDLSQWN